MYYLTKYLIKPETVIGGADAWTLAKYFSSIMLSQFIDYFNQIIINFLVEIEFVKMRNNFMLDIAEKTLDIQFDQIKTANKGNIVNMM